MSEIMPLSELVRVDKYLRFLCRPAAPGSQQQFEQATMADFQSWEQQHCKPKAIQVVQQYASVLNMFAPDHKPLLASVSRVKRVVGV